jgi:hypothetical protein
LHWPRSSSRGSPPRVPNPSLLKRYLPLAQWRAQGRWPESYDRLWELMNERHGGQSGTRAMIALIRMGR